MIPASFGFPFLPASGSWVANATVLGTGTSIALGRQDIGPMMSPVDFVADAAGFDVTSAGVGFARVVIFNTDANGRPTTLHAQSAEIALSATGVQAGAISVTLTKNTRYWAGVWRTVSGGNIRFADILRTPWLAWGGTITNPISSLRRTATVAPTSPDWTYLATQHTVAGFPMIFLRAS